jgi:hypothetical protein
MNKKNKFSWMNIEDYLSLESKSFEDFNTETDEYIVMSSNSLWTNYFKE